MRRPGRCVTAFVVIAFVVTAGLALTVWSPPAGAHSGGRAQLYVDSVRLEPHPGGRQAALVVRDADSGKPEPGFGVELSASSPDGRTIGPVALADPRADGHYAASVPLPDGPWSLTIQAAEIPGGPRAIPFTKTWSVVLHAGQSLALAGPRAPASGGRNGTDAAVLVAVVLLAVAGPFTLIRSRRFRTRAPGNPTPDRPAPKPHQSANSVGVRPATLTGGSGAGHGGRKLSTEARLDRHRHRQHRRPRPRRGNGSPEH